MNKQQRTKLIKEVDKLLEGLYQERRELDSMCKGATDIEYKNVKSFAGELAYIHISFMDRANPDVFTRFSRSCEKEAMEKIYGLGSNLKYNNHSCKTIEDVLCFIESIVGNT